MTSDQLRGRHFCFRGARRFAWQWYVRDDADRCRLMDEP
jgi:hypothetical protein